MKLLLIGANSYVGARLYFDLKSVFPVVGTYSTHRLSGDFLQLDITDQASVEKIIDNQKPDVVVHTANNANSRWCDANPQKAIELNQTSTGYIIDSANKRNAKVIYISTMGAIEPTNLYGRTKAESEQTVKRTKVGYLILRPSLILGFSPNTVNDRPFNRLLRNLDQGEKAIYDTSWKFQPTYLGHISDVIRACLERQLWNQTISISVPDLKSRYDTAYDILTPFGVKVTAVDNHDSTFKIFKDELVELRKFNLPSYSYPEMIGKIVTEIKDRQKYKMS